MPTRKVPVGHRQINLVLPDDFLHHLDQEAQRRTCTRASYLRWLIRRDMEAAPAKAA